ncbi:hypothetical protein [Pseudomonas sp. LG1D9]|uniref:hypothetical protein n=1 Tax=Pseudomonas sp. LG1D9 TaxID=2083054 RepID=UPI001319F6F9|nr:hypothetical protein [Pseudomonas sp. LG1D9]
MVEATHFDRVTAERDAALENVESAEASAQTLHEVISRLKAERDALQALLTAADERVDVMTTALSRIQFRCQSFVESDWAMAVESVEAVLSIAEAALKPAEGGGDEA